MNNELKEEFEKKELTKDYINSKLLDNTNEDFDYDFERVKKGFRKGSNLYNFSIYNPNKEIIKNLFIKEYKDDQSKTRWLKERTFLNLFGLLRGCIESSKILIMDRFDGSYDELLKDLYNQYSMSKNKVEKKKIRDIVVGDVKNIIDRIIVMDFKMGEYVRNSKSNGITGVINKIFVDKDSKVKNSIVPVDQDECIEKIIEQSLANVYSLKLAKENKLDYVSDEHYKDEKNKWKMIDKEAIRWFYGNIHNIVDEMDMLFSYLTCNIDCMTIHSDTRTPNIVYRNINGEKKLEIVDYASVKKGPFAIDLTRLLSDFWLNRFEFFRVEEKRRLFEYGMFMKENLISGRWDLEKFNEETLNKDTKENSIKLSEKERDIINKEFVNAYLWSVLKDIGTHATYESEGCEEYKDFIKRYPEQINEIYIKQGLNSILNDKILSDIYPNIEKILNDLYLPKVKREHLVDK